MINMLRIRQKIFYYKGWTKVMVTRDEHDIF